MAKSKNPDFKTSILLDYAEEYRPAAFYNSNVRKTSQQVVLDLRPIAEFSINEVSEFLIMKGYVINFDEDQPEWLMYRESKKTD